MGTNAASRGVLRAALATLRPFVKRLLALGVRFGELEEGVRALFIEVAENEFAVEERRQTDSRIALLTGLNRKEVRRLRRTEPENLRARMFHMNHATNLIGRWLADPRAVDGKGRPRPIPYQAKRGASFMKLARAVTGDLAPGVLLDELVRTGAAELRDGWVSLRSDSHVPRSAPEQLQILAEDPPEMVETLLRNVLAEEPFPLLQRKVYYDNLGSDAMPRLRREIRRQGERFLRGMNRLLAKYDRDRNPRAPGGARRSAGIGLYAFESDAAPDPSARRARRPKGAAAGEDHG